MADIIYTSQVAAEVIETTNTTMSNVRFTQTSAEVIETNPTDYRIRTSQVALEVILTRQDLKRFIGWGVPISG